MGHTHQTWSPAPSDSALTSPSLWPVSTLSSFQAESLPFCSRHPAPISSRCPLRVLQFPKSISQHRSREKETHSVVCQSTHFWRKRQSRKLGVQTRHPRELLSSAECCEDVGLKQIFTVILKSLSARPAKVNQAAMETSKAETILLVLLVLLLFLFSQQQVSAKTFCKCLP